MGKKFTENRDEETKAKADCFDIICKYVAMSVDDYDVDGIILSMISDENGDVDGGIYLNGKEVEAFKKAGFLVS